MGSACCRNRSKSVSCKCFRRCLNRCFRCCGDGDKIRRTDDCASGSEETLLISSDSSKSYEGVADPNDPEAQKAAVKIQAVFRGHKTRQSISTMKTGDSDPDQAALEAEFRADDEELCHAATRIQASFRGHMARKTAPAGKEDESDKLSQQMQKLDANKAEEEELDIDLTDPDLHKAATKIQASFRGHKVRKEEVAPANQ